MARLVVPLEVLEVLAAAADSRRVQAARLVALLARPRCPMLRLTLTPREARAQEVRPASMPARRTAAPRVLQGRRRAAASVSPRVMPLAAR